MADEWFVQALNFSYQSSEPKAPNNKDKMGDNKDKLNTNNNDNNKDKINNNKDKILFRNYQEYHNVLWDLLRALDLGFLKGWDDRAQFNNFARSWWNVHKRSGRSGHFFYPSYDSFDLFGDGSLPPFYGRICC